MHDSIKALTYLPSLMVLVVCNFNFLEGYFARHPVLSSGRGFRMHVLQHLLAVCFSFSNVNPLGVDVLVSSVVHRVEF